jgi:hypothetical protein
MYHLLHKRPFEPFRLHLSDGRVFDVRYPEMNMVGVTWVRIGVLAPGETDPDPIPDHTVKVPLSYIVNVEPLPVTPSVPQP